MTQRRRRRVAFAAAMIAALTIAPSFADDASLVDAPPSAPQPVPSSSPAIDASPSPSSAPVPAAIALPSVSPDPSASNAPVYGDLSHLTFTATGVLPVSIVSPAANEASGSSATVTVETVIGAGVELRINGDLVPQSRIGKRVVDAPKQLTRYTFYGVPLVSGANVLSATPLGANDARGATVTETIYGAGRPATLAAWLSGTLVADGRTSVPLNVSGSDRWGHPALAGSLVRIAIIAGDAHFAVTKHSGDPVSLVPSPSPLDAGGAHASRDSISSVQSVELPLGDDGTISVPIVPGQRAGDVRVRVSFGDVESESNFFAHAEMRAPIVLGLATAGIGSVPGIPGQPGDAPSGTSSRQGRLAVYASGQIAPNTLGTFTYNSADVLQQTTSTGPFVDDPSSRPYSTYGDASTTADDALSRDHLFARIDRERSSLMWGEFQAQTGGDASAGGFNLLVQGAKVELAGNNAKLTAFHADNDVAFARQVFSPTGLATLGTLLHPSIVVGSEQITLVVLDRRTGIVLTQTPMTPNVDYTLDYDSGMLRFINIPLPYDQYFNPQQILVQYEYQGAGSSATTGARFEAGLGARQQSHVGVGYVNDVMGSTNYSLFGEDLGGKLPGGSWSIGYLTSQGAVPTLGQTSTVMNPETNGDAVRASFTETAGANRYSAGYDWTSAGFSNPFGGLSTPGLIDGHFSFVHTLQNQRGDLSADYDYEQNASAGVDSMQESWHVRLRRILTKRFTFTIGLQALNASDASSTGIAAVAASPVNPVPVATAGPTTGLTQAPASGNTTQAEVGFDWKLFPTVGFSVDRTTDIGSGTNASLPAQTTAQLTGDFGKKGRVYIRELWADAPTDSFAASTAALTSPVLGTRATVFGIERALGSATTLDSEYVLDQTGTGTDIFSTLGIKERFQIAKNLRGDAFVQRGTAVGEGLGGFNIYGISATYASDSRLRASGSYQLRTGDGSGASLSLGAAGALTPSLSLLGTINNSRSGTTGYDDGRVGLAWRPANNARGVTLLEYERQDGSLEPLATHAEILALDQLYRPTTRLELSGRYAYKLDGDSYYPAQTSLVDVRAVQRIGSRFDIGAESSVLSTANIAGTQSTSFALEGGFRIGNEMRVAAGYNFTGAADPMLLAQPTKRGIYLTMTSVIDRIFGWGRDLGWGR